MYIMVYYCQIFLFISYALFYLLTSTVNVFVNHLSNKYINIEGAWGTGFICTFYIYELIVCGIVFIISGVGSKLK